MNNKQKEIQTHRGFTKQQLLNNLKIVWEDCRKCPLHKCNTPSEENSSGKAYGRGNPRAKILLVGEALGAGESRTGRVFLETSPAGRKLATILKHYGLTNRVFITNPVMCRSTRKDKKTGKIKNIKPAPEHVEACRPRFDTIVSIIKPRLIVAMGAGAINALTGYTGTVKDAMGQIFKTEQYGKVLATVHPMVYIYRATDKELITQSDKIWKYIVQHK
jgi:DNA polymerase